MTQKEQIEMLTMDIAVFFKWLHHWHNHEDILQKKHDAVKVQNFEMGVKYREMEKENLEKWEEVNALLNEISEKYIPKL